MGETPDWGSRTSTCELSLLCGRKLGLQFCRSWCNYCAYTLVHYSVCFMRCELARQRVSSGPDVWIFGIRRWRTGHGPKLNAGLTGHVSKGGMNLSRQVPIFRQALWVCWRQMPRREWKSRLGLLASTEIKERGKILSCLYHSFGWFALSLEKKAYWEGAEYQSWAASWAAGTIYLLTHCCKEDGTKHVER